MVSVPSWAQKKAQVIHKLVWLVLLVRCKQLVTLVLLCFDRIVVS